MYNITFNSQYIDIYQILKLRVQIATRKETQRAYDATDGFRRASAMVTPTLKSILTREGARA
jgi:hypothetical protein